MHTAHLIRLGAMVFAAVTCVVIGDTAGKTLTGAGVDPVFVAWSRFLLAAVVIVPLSGLTRAELPNLADWRVLFRAILISAGISCILTALKTEPIANVFGAFFIGPVVAYALAVLFLGETPSRARTVLLCIGFAGVMLVVKPGFGATQGMMFALLAGITYGFYLATTRVVANLFRPRFLLASQLLLGSIILTPLGLTADLPTFDASVSVLVMISAFGSAIGNYLLVLSSKQAEASLIAPLVYSQLISATVAGVIVFGDWPDAVSLVGLALILVSGFGSLALHRSKAGARLS